MSDINWLLVVKKKSWVKYSLNFVRWKLDSRNLIHLTRVFLLKLESLEPENWLSSEILEGSL